MCSKQQEIAQHIKDYTIIVNKSTVPVGTARRVEEVIRKANPNADFDVVSNPEFLREGAAIDDFMRPDRVIVGTTSERARAVMRELYRPLYINETPMVMTTPESSEIIKYASNAFLAVKITFINEIANLCEAVGANVQDVSKGMVWMVVSVPNSCTRVRVMAGHASRKTPLHWYKSVNNIKLHKRFVQTVVEVNNERQKSMADRVIAACGGDVKGKKIAVLGIAFKPNTDDIREAPSLV